MDTSSIIVPSAAPESRLSWRWGGSGTERTGAEQLCWGFPLQGTLAIMGGTQGTPAHTPTPALQKGKAGERQEPVWIPALEDETAVEKPGWY